VSYLDTHVIPGLRSRGVVVVDLRAILPRNTQWPQLRKWSTRPLAAISLFAWHYPAVDRPPLPYDEVGRIFAYARGHIATNWGNNYHAPTITYHTVTGGSGTLYLCNDWESVTWHATDANGIALGFLVDVGQFQQLTPAQVQTNDLLADFVGDGCPEIPADQWDHFGHGELTQFNNWTACPAPVLPYIQTYRATGDMVRRQLEEEDPAVIEELRAQLAAATAELGDVKGINTELWTQNDSLKELLATSQGETAQWMAEAERWKQQAQSAQTPIATRITRVHVTATLADNSTQELEGVPV
jgi:hypothetical protein